MISMCAALVLQEDPLCDAACLVCETCHFKYSCDYLSSGQIALCSKIIAEVEEEFPMEMALNVRLERCFSDMIKRGRTGGVIS